MSEVASWSETPAGMLAGGGWSFEDRAAELAARESERATARAEFEARLASDPAWSATRKLQEALAARGWTGSWVEVSSSVPPELQPLHTAAKAAEARTGTFYEGQPTNDVAREFAQLARDRAEAARLRQQVENGMLPRGVEAL